MSITPLDPINPWGPLPANPIQWDLGLTRRDQIILAVYRELIRNREHGMALEWAVKAADRIMAGPAKEPAA